MEKILEYGMASGHNHLEMLDYVNQQIREGWQPWGHPFTTIHDNTLFIHQAMVMYEVKKKTTK